MRPEDTQKFIIGSSSLGRMIGFLFTGLIGIIVWIGVSLITRVDVLTANFNQYALHMETRVTSLEQRDRRSKE
jgi:hypothetical protein